MSKLLLLATASCVFLTVSAVPGCQQCEEQNSEYDEYEYEYEYDLPARPTSADVNARWKEQDHLGALAVARHILRASDWFPIREDVTRLGIALMRAGAWCGHLQKTEAQGKERQQCGSLPVEAIDKQWVCCTRRKT